MLYGAGCATPLSTFSHASDAAERTATLSWLMVAVSTAIFILVCVVMVAAIARGKGSERGIVGLEERGRGWLLWGGLVLPVVVLSLVSVIAVRVMRQRIPAENAVTILVTGHQWWWQLDYDLGSAQTRFRTANELHVPVGRPVLLKLTTSDVIHSFWVPSLAGKMDLLPGDTNELRVEARRAGTFTGACAEYCGAQHAHMAITVVAEDSASFARWVTAEAAPSVSSLDSTAAAGQQLFTKGVCATCHTVRGTDARGPVGPDLTHVGSRLTIAAGSLTNSFGAIEGWIADPQAIKPGAAMPTLNAYSGPELRALAAYVANLR
ncbi:MAG TPA: cytochrome c oxidase subunit II [Gemmatimonadaceae bacterium]|nr:cytochrome c oxidase subunit II [Gemmatimonadaceae bacterium]